MEWIENMAWAFILVIAWEAVWKSIAMWKAARAGQKAWYIALLLLNTVGIFPIVYLLFFQKNSSQKTKVT